MLSLPAIIVKLLVIKGLATENSAIDRTPAGPAIRFNHHFSHSYQPYSRVLTGPAHHPPSGHFGRGRLLHPRLPDSQFATPADRRGRAQRVFYPRFHRLPGRKAKTGRLGLRGSRFLDPTSDFGADRSARGNFLAPSHLHVHPLRSEPAGLGIRGLPESNHLSVRDFHRTCSPGDGNFEQLARIRFAGLHSHRFQFDADFIFDCSDLPPGDELGAARVSESGRRPGRRSSPGRRATVS